MTHIWKPVRGFPDYLVSDSGQIKRIAAWFPGRIGRNQYTRKSGHLLHPGLVTTGPHFQVRLHRKGRKVQKFVHRVVYESFHGPIPKHLEVNHRDGNGLNNNLSNLELLTHSANVIDGYQRRISQPNWTWGKSKLNADTVREIRIIASQHTFRPCLHGGKVTQVTLAKQFGVDSSTINNILRRKTWKSVA